MSLVPAPLIRGSIDPFTGIVPSPDLDEGVGVGVSVVRSTGSINVPVEVQHAPSTTGGAPSTGNISYVATLSPGQNKVLVKDRRMIANKVQWFRARHRTAKNTGPFTNWIGAKPQEVAASQDVPTSIVPDVEVKSQLLSGQSVTASGTLTIEGNAAVTGWRFFSSGGANVSIHDKNGDQIGVIGATTTAILIQADATNVDLQLDADNDILMPSLPTFDPSVAGALWNNSGVLNVSTG